MVKRKGGVKRRNWRVKEEHSSRNSTERARKVERGGSGREEVDRKRNGGGNEKLKK